MVCSVCASVCVCVRARALYECRDTGLFFLLLPRYEGNRPRLSHRNGIIHRAVHLHSPEVSDFMLFLEEERIR